MVDRRGLKLAARRLAETALTLWLICSLGFFAVRLAPGDPARTFDSSLPADQLQASRALYSLDRPLLAQYGTWLRGLVRGRLGWSFHYRQPVSQVLGAALPPTLYLAGFALTLQYGGAIGLALLTARRSSGLRALADGLATLLYTLPTFWLGLLALHWLGRTWQWFPTWGAGSSPEGAGLAAAVDLLAHVALPATVLAAAEFGLVYKLSDRSLRRLLSAPAAVAARARGVGEGRLLWLHGLRGAMPGAVHRLGVDLPALVSGTLVVEVLFSRPGLGRVAHQAYLARDYPLLAAGAAAAGSLVVLGSLLADTLHSFLDPRIRRD